MLLDGRVRAMQNLCFASVALAFFGDHCIARCSFFPWSIKIDTFELVKVPPTLFRLQVFNVTPGGCPATTFTRVLSTNEVTRCSHRLSKPLSYSACS